MDGFCNKTRATFKISRGVYSGIRAPLVVNEFAFVGWDCLDNIDHFLMKTVHGRGVGNASRTAFRIVIGPVFMVRNEIQLGALGPGCRVRSG